MWHNILVTTDLSPASEPALEAAKQLADLGDSPKVTLAYAMPHDTLAAGALGPSETLAQEAEEAAQDRLELLAARYLGQLSHVKTALLRDPSAAVAITDYAKAENCGVIVIASHGRTGLGRLLIGSVAENVVRHSPCPVLVVRTEKKA